jgi:hypothetical protein
VKSKIIQIVVLNYVLKLKARKSFKKFTLY